MKQLVAVLAGKPGRKVSFPRKRESRKNLRGCPEIRIRAAAPNRFQTLPVDQSARFIGVFGRLGAAGRRAIRRKTEFRDSLLEFPLAQQEHSSRHKAAWIPAYAGMTQSDSFKRLKCYPFPYSYSMNRRSRMHFSTL